MRIDFKLDNRGIITTLACSFDVSSPNDLRALNVSDLVGKMSAISVMNASPSGYRYVGKLYAFKMLDTIPGWWVRMYGGTQEDANELAPKLLIAAHRYFKEHPTLVNFIDA